MIEKLESIKKEFFKDIDGIKDLNELNKIRINYLGKKGIFSEIMKLLKDLPNEEKPLAGKHINDAKKLIEDKIEEIEINLKEENKKQSLIKDKVDISLPGRNLWAGRRNPILIVYDELVEIFKGLGFELAEGPEIEDIFHNFDALNTPDTHPSRDTQDTFYIKNNELLLRTHTSSVQIRTMLNKKPPIRIISPGRVYRNETVDASHEAVFHQLEGLYVAENVTFADLKGTLDLLAKKLFGKEAKARLRPSFFPFTEPSAELDMSCIVCGGKGCRVCKESGWLEIGGAGMVDPNVFASVNIDPEKWTGFAFGFGIERITMLKYRINDIRLFQESNLSFIEQFK